jgi:hypothetical protein
VCNHDIDAAKTFQEIRVCGNDAKRLNRKLQNGESIQFPPILVYYRKKTLPLPTNILEQAHTFALENNYGETEHKDKYRSMNAVLLHLSNNRTATTFIYTFTKASGSTFEFV